MSLSPRVAGRNGRSPNRRDLSPPPVHYHNGHRTPSPNPSPNANRTRPKRAVHSPTGEPLLEPDALPRQPPLAPSEDSSGDDRETVNYPQPGVDDGLMPDSTINPEAEFFTPDQEKIPIDPPYPDPNPDFDDPDFVRPDIYPRNNFPYAPGYGPDFTEFNGSESIPDVNVYQHKKTLAQGMMDLALFSANASQLRYVLEAGGHAYFIISVILISFSLILQVAIGVGLIWNSRYNVKDKKQICIANKISNFTIIGIFLVTVVNVFISAFGVSTPAAVPVIIAPRSGGEFDELIIPDNMTFT